MFTKKSKSTRRIGFAMALLTVAMSALGQQMPGSASRISVGKDGSIWAIGTHDLGGGNKNIMKWNGSAFADTDGAAVRIAVDNQGLPWVVNAAGEIFKRNGSTWVKQQGSASEIAVGGDGSVWAIGTRDTGGGNKNIILFNSSNGSWQEIPGQAVKITVDKQGAPWVLTAANVVFKRNTQVAGGWEQKPGAGHELNSGADGTPWIIGTGGSAGNYDVYKWNGSTNWDSIGMTAATATSDAQGTPWLVKANGDVVKSPTLTIVSNSLNIQPVSIPSTLNIQTGPIITTGTLVVQPSTVTTSSVLLSPSATWDPSMVPSSGGQMLCSAGTVSTCGKVRADWVGPYALNMNCSDGFYDPIYGGTCWKCPSDSDALGATNWTRNITSVENDDACWRFPKETFTKAQAVKGGVNSGLMSWDCDSGQFWEMRDASGNWTWWGGTCWTCPDAAHPRRTAFNVWESQACVTPIRDTAPGIFVKFNGCPKPNATAMGLAGKKLPGKPFLDIAGGWSAGAAGGGCFACPVTDEDGNILVTERNADTLINAKDTNQGCTIKFKWKLPPFPEPGLTGLNGAAGVMMDQRYFQNPDFTTNLFYALAEKEGMANNTPAAKDYVTKKWQEVAGGPSKSPVMQALVYGVLRHAVSKTPAKRTPSEVALISAFQTYIQTRRTFIAQQALNMYDAWKADDDRQRSSVKQSPLTTMFYYGTVPFDFQSTAMAGFGLGSFGVGVGSSMAAYSAFGSRAAALQEAALDGWFLSNPGQTMATVQASDSLKGSLDIAMKGASRVYSLYANFQGFDVLQAFKGATLVSVGATVITIVASIIASIAIDQFVAIETARPKLENALAVARQPVDLGQLLGAQNGEDNVAYFWAKAMDNSTAPENSQLASLATQALQAVQAKGYAKPN